MGFNCGIVGLPNVGKSTIFNALTAMSVPAEAFPFCTIDPNVGRVIVADEHLDELARRVQPEKVTPTHLEFVDIAGLVKGASKGDGLGNLFLGQIRAVDAIAHVVRCFRDPDVAHVAADIDPADDIGVINLELVLADLAVVENRLEKQGRLAKVGDKAARAGLALLEEIKLQLEQGRPVRQLEAAASPLVREMGLLTAKPMMIVLNVGEEDPAGAGALAQTARQQAEADHLPVVALSGKIEAELAALDPAEQQEYRATMELGDSGLQRMIRAGYALLDLITFYTTVGVELRAWTIPRGTPAQTAAGRIHSDMERGFIKAEVIHYDDFIAAGNEHRAREAGLIHMEGKEYAVQDRDIIRFRFNV
ncbi:MAG: redox-regulated ATPase YchF [Acidobacteria bacterium]|nr:redox-regulated ATPase YchF [Acidobacteriota bacterium]